MTLRLALTAALFAFSLTANVWLLLKWRTNAGRPSSSAPAETAIPKPPIAPSDSKAAIASASATTPTTDADFRALHAQLQAAGLPPEVVRAAVAIMIHRSFQKRREALLARPGPDEYWKNPPDRSHLTDQTALRELEREQRKMLREVAGGDLEMDESSQRRQFGGLPDEKIAKLRKIFSDYGDLEEQLFSENSDRGSAGGRAQSALLAKEKRADIERLLTPEELLNYDLRNSQAAHSLRRRLGSFQATEAEFRALYPAHKAAADTAGAAGPRGAPQAEVRRAREEEERRVEAEVRSVLGEARYAEFKEANDQDLQQTRSLVASLNLPPTAAAEVVAVQKEFQPRLAAVERDRDLTPNQRDAQLAALGLEARTRLTSVLGASGFESYKRRGGGWLGASINASAPAPFGRR